MCLDTIALKMAMEEASTGDSQWVRALEAASRARMVHQVRLKILVAVRSREAHLALVPWARHGALCSEADMLALEVVHQVILPRKLEVARTNLTGLQV